VGSAIHRLKEDLMTFKLLAHVRRNVVAYLALFIALGGTAVAARPLITGADVQDNSLTGADILESSLGQVPSAASASSADSAGQLDGTVDTEVATMSESILFRDGPHTETVTCPADGLALRGSHSESGDPVDQTSESYSRSSYSVTYVAASGNVISVSLAVRCLTGTAPTPP
jgi:hypothetical protein